MIESVLAVCTGNICRSPLAEYELRRLAPQLTVASAGVAALAGRPADLKVQRLAEREGLDLSGHRARQVNREILDDYDLVLVMEAHHREWLIHQYPQYRAKVVLITHWDTQGNIVDPFRRSAAVYELVHRKILACCREWSEHLLSTA